MKTRTPKTEPVSPRDRWLRSMTRDEILQFYFNDIPCLLGESVEQLENEGIAFHLKIESLFIPNHIFIDLRVSWGTNKLLMIRHDVITDLYEVFYDSIHGWTTELDADLADVEDFTYTTIKHHRSIRCDGLHKLLVKYSKLSITPPNPAQFSAPHRLKHDCP